MRFFVLTNMLLAGALLAACGAETRLPQPRAEHVRQEAQIQQRLVTREAMRQQQLALKDMAAAEARLYRIGQPILVANRQFCGKHVAARYGFALHSAEDYSRQNGAAAIGIFSFGDLPKIYAVAPGPATAAGLKAGDEIVTANNSTDYPTMLKTILFPEEDGILNLILRRDGETFAANLAPQRQCDFKFNLRLDDTVNAETDGKEIYLTTGIMRYLDEDIQVAGVFGHELAHITMEHVDKKKTQVLTGAIIGSLLAAVARVDIAEAAQVGAEIGAGAYSQEYEAEADYVGAYYTARAGWDVSGLPDLWRRMAVGNPAAIHSQSGTHPSSAFRFSALEQAVAEIRTKRANSEELAPNPKK